MRSLSLKTLVIGLGNPILSDDGVGVRVAEDVQSLLPKDTEIIVTEVSVGGTHSDGINGWFRQSYLN